MIEEDGGNYPTYICPRCETVPRAFFSVSDAPKQVGGPTGYVALAFAIYVIGSLFIFGLEESIDCLGLFWFFSVPAS